MSSYFQNNYILNSIQSIKGIGPKIYKVFEDKIGTRIIDLLLYTPYKSIDRFKNHTIKNARKGELLTVEVEVVETNIKKSYYKKRIPSKIITFGTNEDKNKRLDIVYFNLFSNNLNNTFKIGNKFLVSGKLEIYNGTCQITHPDYVVPLEKKGLIPEFDPIYKLYKGIKKRNLVNFIQDALRSLPKIPEWISKKTLKELKLISFEHTLIRIHNPKEDSDNDPDSFLLRRLAFDELLANYIKLKILKDKISSKASNIISKKYNINKQFISNLPFKLTDDQKNAIKEINDDLENFKPMLRLLQGDVGCGKTIVALCSMLKVIDSGCQAVLMAPTEVLAKQHYETIKEFLKDTNINPVLILGQTRVKKDILTENLNSIYKGTSKLIIGTHALISKNTEYNNLKLAIIDEQHRFGVNQRIAIAEKGSDVNLLVMTATPIPRSLALTCYGDMSITNLKQKPKGRKTIETSMISSKRINELLDGLKRKIKEGSFIYWICPTIEESEDNNLMSIEERFKKLKKKFPNLDISIAHGKQKPEERNLSIYNFKIGKSKILLATTVVEVGVDITDADIIVIECSNRYGLSQLHQLRGRVGRGLKKSNCILLYEHNLSNLAKLRLKTLKNNHDGFLIAEEDLVLRGPGEILGTKQSGLNSFRFVNFKFHNNLIEIAKNESELIYKNKQKDSDKIKSLLQIYQSNNFLKNLGG